MLICPICKKNLEKIGCTYKCQNNHSFDISKNGYTNLLINHPNGGDNKEMVNARLTFLNNGYYSPLKERIKEIAKSYNTTITCDLGCGPGYYSNDLDGLIYGFDISKDAIIKASKNPKGQYFVSSSAFVPLSSESVDMALIVFAPSFEDEIVRILKNDGILVLVTPAKKHLIELKESLYDNPYLNDEKEPSFSKLELISKEELTYQKNITKEDILNLIKMTPYFYKTDQSSFNKITTDKTITISFNISIYQKNPRWKI